jgi:hypothetical protein
VSRRRRAIRCKGFCRRQTPEVLGLNDGDRISLDVTAFRQLADAFLADLEAKFA